MSTDEDPRVVEALRTYIAARADKICERCGKCYDMHQTIMVATGIKETQEDLPKCAAFTFDTETGEVAFAPCDKTEVLH